MKAKEIDGWMGGKSLRWLRKAGSRAKRAVEVGCWKGRSTKAIASRCPGVVWAVDTWAGVPDDPDQHEKLYADGVDEVWEEFLANLDPEIKARRVVPLRMDSLAAARRLTALTPVIGPPLLDFVFLDGDHRYEAVRSDIQHWLPLIRPGGLMAGHDIHWPGVERAVSELLPGYERGPGVIWYWRVPAAEEAA